MAYNPLTWRRMDWFRYDLGQAYPWRERATYTADQATLIRHTYHGVKP